MAGTAAVAKSAAVAIPSASFFIIFSTFLTR
jgi:hypothetical protein